MHAGDQAEHIPKIQTQKLKAKSKYIPILEQLLSDLVAGGCLLLALHSDPDHVCSRICTLLHLQEPAYQAVETDHTVREDGYENLGSKHQIGADVPSGFNAYGSLFTGVKRLTHALYAPHRPCSGGACMSCPLTVTCT